MVAAGLKGENRFQRLLFANGRRLDFPLILAPMAGLTHVAFRQLVRSYLPAGASTLFFTEMLSTRLLPDEVAGKTPLTLFAGGEDDLVPQLLGNEQELIARSIENLQAMRPAGIDINMGCSVSKVLKQNWGVALMKDIRYAEQVVRATRAATRAPLSVKLRTGLKDDMAYLLEFAAMLVEAGVDWLTIHPRSQEQWRRGQANWDYVARLRAAVRIPVVGNGDIQQASDVERRRQETRCDAVMVGRALTARPWLFWQLGERWGWPPPPGRQDQRAPQTPEEEGCEYGRALLYFCGQLEHYFSPEEQMPRLEMLLTWGHHWLIFGHYLWVQIKRCSDLSSARATITEFFSTPKTMSAETMLK